MELKPAGRVALVTGASRGIGRAIAVALAREGLDVALVARAEQQLAETARLCEAHGVKAHYRCCDFTRPAELEQVVPWVVDQLGELNVLVNNAGLLHRGPIEEADAGVWQQMIDVNVTALVQLTRLALPEILGHPDGAVINISSRSGKFAFTDLGLYCATKHAVVGFSNVLFEEIRERGVKVCVVCPGMVDTEMVSGWEVAFEKALRPEDVAQTILYVLSTPSTACPTEIILNPQRNPYA